MAAYPLRRQLGVRMSLFKAIVAAVYWKRGTLTALMARRVLCTCPGLILVAQATAAQSGEVRCTSTGTQLSFSEGTTVESLGDAVGFICRFNNARTARGFDRILGHLDLSSPLIKANLDRIRTLIPLQVGKGISFVGTGADNLGGNGTWSYSISVEKYEAVVTPAGTLQSFLILWVEQSFGSGGKWERRWWYSPQVGYAVQVEFKTTHGNPPKPYPPNYQLTTIRLPQSA